MRPKSKSLLTPVRTTSRLTASAAAVTIVAVAVAALAGLTGRTARAFPTCTSCTQTLLFGMVGIAPGQTGRLNVFMPNGPPNVITISFTDSNGSHLTDPVSGQPAQTSLMLAPGQAASLDLAYPAASPNMPQGPPIGPFASGGRVAIRALVEVSSVEGGHATSDFIATLELFDTATGRTSVVLTPINPGRPAD